MASVTGQYSIIDLNDIIVSNNPPTNLVIDLLWLNTSVTPTQLQKWNGTSWDIVNDSAFAIKTANDYTDEKISNYAETVTNSIGNLQNQIDGSITTWFYPVPPTNNSAPTIDWTSTELKNNHLGDLYYDTNTGYSYRYQVSSNVYGWSRITDTDITKALADASTAKDTADSKRRVFVATPTTPYDVGDLWSQGTTGDLMRCITSRSSGVYNASDWDKASKYTDDTTVNNLQIGGRNLCFHTSGDYQSVNVTGWGMGATNVTMQPGHSYTYRVYLSTVNQNVSVRVNVRIHTKEDHSEWLDYGGNTIQANSEGYSTVTLTVPSVCYTPQVSIVFLAWQANTYTIKWKEEKLESGNKATDWTPAPEDVSEYISNAQTKADNAKNSADAANVSIANISDDNKLTPVEKTSVRKEWDTIYGEYSGNVAQADAFGITTEKINYTNAFVSLGTYLNAGVSYTISSIIPSWISDTNLSTITDITGSIFRSNFVTFYNVRQTLLNAIATKAKSLANTAQNTVDNLQIGGRNLLLNGDFNKGIYTNFGFYEWRNNGRVKYGYNFINDSHYIIGTYTPYMRAESITNNDVGGVLYSDAIDVVAGETYTLSYKEQLFRGIVTIEHHLLGGGNNFISYVTWLSGAVINLNGGTYDPTNNHETQIGDEPNSKWRDVYITFTAPSNAVKFRFQMVLQYSYNDAFYFVDNIKLEKGNKATDWTPAPEDVAAATANAQTTANSKNTVFYANTMPTANKVNDIWINTGDSNRIYTWDGTSWADTQFGTNAIKDLSITNAKIERIHASKILAETLSAISANLGSINAGKISLNIGDYTVIPSDVNLGIYGKNTNTGRYNSTYIGLERIYLSDAQGPYGDVMGNVVERSAELSKSQLYFHNRASAEAYFASTQIWIKADGVNDTIKATSSQAVITNSAGGVLTVASTTTTESSILYSINGTSRWGVGSGTGLSDPNYFGWYACTGPAPGLKMSLSNSGDLNCAGKILAKSANGIGNSRVMVATSGSRTGSANDIGLDWNYPYLRIYVDNTVVATWNMSTASWS